MNRPQWKWILTLSLTAGLAGTYGCSSASSSNNNGGGGGGGGTGSNVASIVVNSGPGAGPPANRPYINGAFASVTVCVPGSTSQCQTIGGILVDTGSPGLRILASALTVSLPQQTIGGAPVVECTPFADGFTGAIGRHEDCWRRG